MLTLAPADRRARVLAQKLDPSGVEVIERADDADLPIGNRLVDDRRCGFQSLDVEGDVLPDGVVEHIASLAERRLDGGADGRHQRGQMTRQGTTVLQGFE